MPRLRLALLVLIAALAGSAAVGGRASGAWGPPVTGEVVRSFAYARGAPFVRGAHRGVDLAARPGTAVRAVCDGRVAHAGGSPGGRVVTLRCGGWRVTVLPLAAVSVRAGDRVRAGARLGTAGRGGAHAGLHVGVRAAGDPFGYVDPLGFVGGVPGAPALPLAAPVRRGSDLGSAPPVASVPVPVPVVAGPPAAAAMPGAASALAPSPAGSGVPGAAWAGLALVAVGAAGSGGVAVRRRRRVARATGARQRHAVTVRS